jgi:hypothetical protein
MQQAERSLTERLSWLCEQNAFTELESKLNTFNPFRVLQVERYELRHTTTLAWLLDPSETHCMGHVFLKHFVAQFIDRSAPWVQDALNEIVAGNVEIHRELKFARHGVIASTIADNADSPTGDRLDILIEGKDWGIAVEAKIDSKEGENQLLRYEGWLRTMFREKVVNLYLTVGSEDLENPNWRNIQWGFEVKKALEAAVSELGESSLPTRVREFLADYRDLVSGLSDRNHIQDESLVARIRAFVDQDDIASVLHPLQQAIEAKKIVRRWDDGGWPAIYWQHKSLLDLCVKHLRPRDAAFAWKTVQEMIDNHGGAWDILTYDASKALKLEFVPRSWRDLSRLTMTGEKWNICYSAEFRREQEDIEIKLHFRRNGERSQQFDILDEFLSLLSSNACPPVLRLESGELSRLKKTAVKFQQKKSASMKVYSVKAGWMQREDGGYFFAGEQQNCQNLEQFKAVVEAHTKLLADRSRQKASNCSLSSRSTSPV